MVRRPESIIHMLIRIVRMTFRPEVQGDFMALFDASAPEIRAFPGCRHLELWQDAHDPSVLTTYSLWQSAEALESYRTSALFETTWAAAKRLFAAPPQAASYYARRDVQAARP